MNTFTFNLALVLDRLAAAAPPCAYGLGAAFLAVKVFSVPAPVTPARLALAAGCLLLVWVIADLLRMGGPWFSADYARAWLDLRNHSGGKIIAGDIATMPNLKVWPKTSLRHMAKRLVLPVIFVVAAWLVPVPVRQERMSGAGVERAIARVEREVDEAAVASAIPKPDADELRRQLRQLEELAERNPEAAAEALASLPAKLESAMSRRLDRAADALEKAAAALKEMEKAGADGQADPVASAELERRLDEMYKALDQLAKGEGGMERLSPELQNALGEMLQSAGVGTLEQMAGASGSAASASASAMNREALEKLLQALKESGGEMAAAALASGMTGDMEGGMPGAGDGSSASSGKRAGRPGGADGALGRLQSLTEALEGMNLAEIGVAQGAYGSGGIDRGRGDAPLVFGDEADAAGMRFDYTPLPEPRDNDPGLLIQRDRVAPPDAMPPEEFRPVRRSGAVVPGQVYAGEGAAALGPERAAAAERYFKNLGEKR